MRISRRRLHAALVAAVLAVTTSACSSDDTPAIELGLVAQGEVVETVAAPATIQPRDRVTVSAPASGTVAELFVADGDRVGEGEALLRLDAPSVEQSIAQARAAVEAADALAGAAVSIDLSPVVRAMRTQLESSVPALLETLANQAVELPEEHQETAFEAISRLSGSYDSARAALLDAEHEAQSAAARASAAQRAAAAAQRQQAELALEAARSRADELTVLAPASGVIELARGGGGGATPDLEGLGGLGDVSEFEGLLGGGGATSTSTAPIAVGAEVAAGQPLLTVFDLSGFRAIGDVDEIDVVDVDTGQDVVVLVDAFPEWELAGRVEHVALEPADGPAGGVVYPITVELVRVPTDVRLRAGLSGSVEIVTRVIEDAVTVPSSALRRRGETELIYVVRGDVIREVAVTVTAIGDDTAAIAGDVEVGEQVVIGGIDEVSDGDPAPDV